MIMIIIIIIYIYIIAWRILYFNIMVNWGLPLGPTS